MLIVADDLTGAADSAAPFAAAGASTVVLLGVSTAGSPDAAVVSIDTDGRALDADAAADATAAAVREHPGRAVLVKIDSTLRGHVAETVRAAFDALAERPRRIVICPAFPALGRTVVHGRLHVDGALLGDHDLEAMFTSMFSAMPTGAIEGVTAHVLDASTAADLAAIVGRHHDPAHPEHTMWVGSGGLARHLVTAVAGDAMAVERPRAARIAVVAGSQHERTLRQLDHLESRGASGVRTFRLDPRDPDCVRRIVPDLAEADGLVLTGGLTARLVLDALGIDRIRLGGEVEVGLPWSIATVGHGPQLRTISVVTKAGGFGTATSLLGAAAFLAG